MFQVTCSKGLAARPDYAALLLEKVARCERDEPGKLLYLARHRRIASRS